MMKADLSRFYVITCISNTARYKSRYELYRKFEAMVKSAGVKLITVEMALGDRPFEITERDNPMHLQVRSIDEMFHKENMLNLSIQYLMQIDPQAREVAWIDADVFPTMLPIDWFSETWHQLQVHEVVQMFEYAQDLDPNYNHIGKIHHGFMATYVKSGYTLPKLHGNWKMGYYEVHGHPGYCFAANISAITVLGGLCTVGILGSNDRHMCMALLGVVEQSRSEQLSPGYKNYLKTWQERALRYIKKDVGYVKGTITHMWHGAKKNRGYSSRWKVLIECQFDPYTDLKIDAQGLFQFETHSDRQILLRDRVRSYMRSRNEDCVYTGE